MPAIESIWRRERVPPLSLAGFKDHKERTLLFACSRGDWCDIARGAAILAVNSRRGYGFPAIGSMTIELKVRPRRRGRRQARRRHWVLRGLALRQQRGRS